MSTFNSRAKWWLLLGLLSVPWIALDMPMFSSNALNALVFGVIGYLVEYVVERDPPSLLDGRLILIVGGVAALILFAVGVPAREPHGYLYKLWLCSCVVVSSGASEIIHALVRETIFNR